MGNNYYTFEKYFESHMTDDLLRCKTNTPQKLPEDLLELANTYAVPDLEYVDIPKQDSLTKILKKWTLLAELNQC